jgi:hypothetical protein
MKLVLWDTLKLADGYKCCWRNKRTGTVCEKIAYYAERKLRQLTIAEFTALDQTGLAYCKQHWSQRNAQ